jgi:hypothetical protein
MKKLSESIKYWTGDPIDGGEFKARVSINSCEAFDLENAPRDAEVVEQLFETAGCRSAYYGGPGQPFVHEPSFHLTEGKTQAVVSQSFGYDI